MGIFGDAFDLIGDAWEGVDGREGSWDELVRTYHERRGTAGKGAGGTPAQEQPTAADEPTYSDNVAVAESMMRDFAVRDMEAVRARDKKESPITTEDTVRLLGYFNASALPEEARLGLSQDVELANLTAEYEKVLDTGDQAQIDAFGAKLASPKYAALMLSAQGLNEPEDSADMEEAKAAEEEMIRLQELEYQRTALLDYLDVFPEKLRGIMLMEMIDNPQIKEMFFPGIKQQPTEFTEVPMLKTPANARRALAQQEHPERASRDLNRQDKEERGR